MSLDSFLKLILAAVGYFTRWPEACANSNKEASTIAGKLVDEWVCRFGVIQRLNAHGSSRSFESEIFPTENIDDTIVATENISTQSSQ